MNPAAVAARRTSRSNGGPPVRLLVAPTAPALGDGFPAVAGCDVRLAAGVGDGLAATDLVGNGVAAAADARDDAVGFGFTVGLTVGLGVGFTVGLGVGLGVGEGTGAETTSRAGETAVYLAVLRPFPDPLEAEKE